MIIVILIINLLAGATLLYLSHPHQGWRAQPLRRGCRWLGAALLLGGLIASGSLYPVNTAICAYAAGLMLVWGLLPFASLLFPALRLRGLRPSHCAGAGLLANGRRSG